MSKNLQLDRDWLKSAILLPVYGSTIKDARHGSYRKSRFKYTDTTLGGNYAINPPPQWAPSADVRVNRPAVGNPGEGMGRAYSDLLDDNSQLIHMRFGVPQYNSLTSFFSSFYNHEAAVLARTGRAPSVFYYIGKAIGFVVTIPLLPIVFAGNLYNFLANKQPGKFYYLKAAMPTYWQAANSMCNGVAVAMGIIPRVFSNSGEKPQNAKVDDVSADGEIFKGEESLTEVDVKRIHDFMPSLFNKGGGVDLFAVATRGQRLASMARTKAIEAYEKSTTPDALSENFKQYGKEMRIAKETSTYRTGGFEEYMKKWSDLQAGGARNEETSDSDDISKNKDSWLGSFIQHSVDELRDGAAFVTFRVNNTGPVSYSWSNNTQESEVKSNFNSKSSENASKRFNLAEGSLGGGMVGEAIQSAFGKIKDMAIGVAEGMGISGLAGLAGNAFIDIPDRWSDSISSLPSMSYTIELNSPYGGKMARFQNIFIPLCMLLAAALPKAAGKASYTMPFLVELYDKGRNQIRLGIIESISAELGSGNMGFNQSKEALSCTVNLSIKDLSTIMYMPLNASPGLFDEDNKYTDFLATLGSMGLHDQIYTSQRLKINATRMLSHWKSYTSPAKWANMAVGTLPGRMISSFARMTDRTM